MTKSIWLLLLAVTMGACTTGPNNPMPSAPSVETPTPRPSVGPTGVESMQVALSSSPSPARAGDLAHLMTTAAGTSAPIGATTYQWTFGDGQAGSSGETWMNHTYGSKGTFLVHVTATDSTQRTGEASMTIAVTSAPSVPAPAPTPTPAPVTPTLSASLTCTPAAALATTVCNLAVAYGGVAQPSTTIGTVAADWGDGTPEMLGTTIGPLLQHKYSQVGAFLLVVKVTATPTTPSGLGPQTATATQTITVK